MRAFMDAGRLRQVLRRVAGRDGEPGAGYVGPDDPRRATTTETDWSIIQEARQRSMTSEERLQALIDSVRYVVDRGVPGDFVECGVWLGGSVLCMVRTLQDMGVTDRDIWLFDTFEGMSEPTELDYTQFGDESALESWKKAKAGGETPWPYWFGEDTFTEGRVKELLFASGYPEERFHFVRGKVEETIPANGPERISLLRLDTDWYESTAHELEHLYPRLEQHGILILDDYGHWDGARQAVDEHFAQLERVLLTRIDYAARILVKP